MKIRANEQLHTQEIPDLQRFIMDNIGGEIGNSGQINLRDGRSLTISCIGKYGSTQTWSAMLWKRGDEGSIHEVVVSSIQDILDHVATKSAN